MKIVHIEDYFHPDAGYQINILPKYMKKAGYDVTIITSEMDKIPESLTGFFGRDKILDKDKNYTRKYGVKIIRLPLRAFVSGRAVFRFKDILRTIKNEDPDVIYVHGNDTLTGIRYLLNYKKLNHPLIMDSHMLEMASQNKFNKIFRWGYKHFITPIVKKNKIQVIRTQDDQYVEKCLGIPLSQAPWITVGSDTMLFHPDINRKKQFREKNGIDENDFVILYAGKLDESKGGMLLAEAVKEKFPCEKNIVVCVVGKTVGEYGEKVEALFQESENRVLRYPTQKYEDLAMFYQAADLAVFPRQCSLSFYDVQACGLPVIFEDNNINVGRICKNNAIAFKHDNVKDFKEKMCMIADMNKEQFENMQKDAIDYVSRGYDYKKIAERYCELIEKEVQRQKGKC